MVWNASSIVVNNGLQCAMGPRNNYPKNGGHKVKKLIIQKCAHYHSRDEKLQRNAILHLVRNHHDDTEDYISFYTFCTEKLLHQ